MGAMMFALPGIGTEQVSAKFRATLSFAMAAAVATSGIEAPFPKDLAHAGMMVISEILLGYLLGSLPSYIINSLAVTGQVVSASIGLGMANMIDPSIGQNISVLSRIQVLVATVVFLLLDAHHIIIRAASGLGESIPLGTFVPDMATSVLLLERFHAVFAFAISVSAPVLVTVLITQFVLGLLTKFIPQVNVFIVSLPLSIGLGLFITIFTFTGMVERFIEELTELEENVMSVVVAR